MVISYNSTIGALQVVITFAVQASTLTILEYCNDNDDSACITVSALSNVYILSQDQNKGPVGNTWRSIGYYDETASKKVTGMQQFLPAAFGGVIMYTTVDSNQKLATSSYITCYFA